MKPDPRDSPKLNQVEKDGERIKRIYRESDHMAPKPHTEPIARYQGEKPAPVDADGKPDPAKSPGAAREIQGRNRKRVLKALNAFALLQATLRRQQAHAPSGKGILRGKPASRIVPLDVPRRRGA